MRMHTTEVSVKLTALPPPLLTLNLTCIAIFTGHTLTQKLRAWNNETVLNLLAEETYNSLV